MQLDSGATDVLCAGSKQWRSSDEGWGSCTKLLPVSPCSGWAHVSAAPAADVFCQQWVKFLAQIRLKRWTFLDFQLCKHLWPASQSMTVWKHINEQLLPNGNCYISIFSPCVVFCRCLEWWHRVAQAAQRLLQQHRYLDQPGELGIQKQIS